VEYALQMASFCAQSLRGLVTSSEWEGEQERKREGLLPRPWLCSSCN